MSDQSSPNIPRENIAEISNLASIDPRARASLFKILVLWLIRSDFQWIVATGGRALQSIFKRHGLSTRVLTEARECDLPQKMQTWGSYYDDNPVVIAGQVQNGIKLIGSPSLSRSAGAMS